MTNYILTVKCPTRVGLVAAIANFLAERQCNITDASQFDDTERERFFARLTFQAPEQMSLEQLKAEVEGLAVMYQMQVGIYPEGEKMKSVIMVSRFGHCLNDLLYRSSIGALPIEVVGVISNHMDYQKLVANHDIGFHCIKVTNENKKEAEARQMAVIEDAGAELVILARYMQILSDQMCQTMSGRIINIHHSFLPSFKGANPYKQAYARGVKLIGATSHYVTAVLDEGPIIEQETVRVTHRHTNTH